MHLLYIKINKEKNHPKKKCDKVHMNMFRRITFYKQIRLVMVVEFIVNGVKMEVVGRHELDVGTVVRNPVLTCNMR